MSCGVDSNWLHFVCAAAWWMFDKWYIVVSSTHIYLGNCYHSKIHTIIVKLSHQSLTVDFSWFRWIFSNQAGLELGQLKISVCEAFQIEKSSPAVAQKSLPHVSYANDRLVYDANKADFNAMASGSTLPYYSSVAVINMAWLNWLYCNLSSLHQIIVIMLHYICIQAFHTYVFQTNCTFFRKGCL